MSIKWEQAQGKCNTDRDPETDFRACITGAIELGKEADQVSQSISE